MTDRDVDEAYSVGALARLAHVSVRTLHHYDEIGLLRPSGRTSAGYRRYRAADLARLREILFYRELDFGLADIAGLLDEPDADTDRHLRDQHRLLRERISRDQTLLSAIEKEMEARQMGISLSPEEQFEVFGTDKVGGEWAEEARRRWGDSDAFRESQRRTTQYTKQDWEALKAESDEGLRNFVAAMSAGEPADGPAVRALAEAHRQFISRWFYDCDYEIHRGLAQLYVSDDRFRQTFDVAAPGLAGYVHDAIHANADANG